MIQALQIQPQILTSNTDDINFTTIDVRSRSASCSGWLQYSNGSNNFTIIGGGVYKLSFSANVTSATAGQVALAVKTNGNDIEGTEVDVDVATEDTYTNVAFTKILSLCPRTNTTISVGSLATIGGVTPAVTTQVPTIKDANFIIERIA